MLNIVDFLVILLVILFVLEHLFGKGSKMSAQIIEFPVDRVRRPVPAQRISRYQEHPAQVQIPTSVRVARATIFWSLVLGLASLMFFSGSSDNYSAQATSTGSSQGAPETFTYITVYSGDTLWSLAAKYQPNRDPRDFIADIVALNNLQDSVISAGMQLALPNN